MKTITFTDLRNPESGQNTQVAQITLSQHQSMYIPTVSLFPFLSGISWFPSSLEELAPVQSVSFEIPTRCPKRLKTKIFCVYQW